ncbi:hypothetical protein ISCGN_008823 [Ixodes scapularis]
MAEPLALKAPLRVRHIRSDPALKDSRLREAGAEVVYCLTRGAPKGPNLPRARLNHQDALFPGHGKATHSHTWAGEPTWLGVRGDATLQTPAFTGHKSTCYGTLVLEVQKRNTLEARGRCVTESYIETAATLSLGVFRD